jgi:hypothetical protein
MGMSAQRLDETTKQAVAVYREAVKKGHPRPHSLAEALARSVPDGAAFYVAIRGRR